jgi:hypothetical protein
MDASERDRDSAQAAYDDASDQSTPPASSELCDGSGKLRLAAVSSLSGVGYGDDVMYEDGAYPLLIDGSCKYYVRHGAWSTLRSGVLSGQQMELVRDRLRYDEWAAQTGKYCDGAYDSPARTYWYAGESFQVVSCMPAKLPPLNPEQPLLTLIADLYEQANDLTNASLRYELTVDPGTSAPERYRGGASWPFGDPRPLVALPTDDNAYPRPLIHLATAQEATVLRGLRSRFLSGEIGDATFIPVVQGDGTVYKLTMRDVGPFENAEGAVLLPE